MIPQYESMCLLLCFSIQLMATKDATKAYYGDKGVDRATAQEQRRHLLERRDSLTSIAAAAAIARATNANADGNAGKDEAALGTGAERAVGLSRTPTPTPGPAGAQRLDGPSRTATPTPGPAPTREGETKQAAGGKHREGAVEGQGEREGVCGGKAVNSHGDCERRRRALDHVERLEAGKKYNTLQEVSDCAEASGCRGAVVWWTETLPLCPVPFLIHCGVMLQERVARRRDQLSPVHLACHV